MAKIHVLTVKLTCHIPVDPGNVTSVQLAASLAVGLRETGEKLGQTTLDTRLNRVAVPEPEPAPVVPEAPDAVPPDNLDIPDNLRRPTPRPAP